MAIVGSSTNVASDITMMNNNFSRGWYEEAFVFQVYADLPVVFSYKKKTIYS